MPLTDLKLRSLKGKERAYKLSDSEGLYVLVSMNGARSWRLAYRYQAKQKSLALGQYPTTTLLEARRARDEAKELLANGVDPAVARRSEKRKKMIASGNTFQVVAQEWFEMNAERWVESYSSRLKSRLDEDLIPVLGKRPIAEIEPLEVLDAIRKIESRGAIEMAKRVMQTVRARAELEFVHGCFPQERCFTQRRRAAEKKRFKRSRGEEKNARKDAARAERCPISRGDTVFRRDRDDRRSLDLSLCRRTRHGRLSIKRESSVEKKTSPTDLISGRI